jgi:hypothetical protein
MTEELTSPPTRPSRRRRELVQDRADVTAAVEDARHR